MSAHFREIRDVTDMIPLSIFVHIFVLHLASTERFDSLKRLEDRTTVRPPATDVIPELCTRVALWRGSHRMIPARS